VDDKRTVITVISIRRVVFAAILLVVLFFLLAGLLKQLWVNFQENLEGQVRYGTRTNRLDMGSVWVSMLDVFIKVTSKIAPAATSSE